MIKELRKNICNSGNWPYSISFVGSKIAGAALSHWKGGGGAIGMTIGGVIGSTVAPNAVSKELDKDVK